MSKLLLDLRRSRLEVLAAQLLLAEQRLRHRIKDLDQATRQRMYIKATLH